MGRDTDLPGYGGYPDPVYGITDFVGTFFTCGLAGGSAFHFAKGIRDSASRGAPARLAGAVQAVRANSLRVAGNFGGYCTVFSAIETAVSCARGREDMWSSVVASAATGGLHGMRRGGATAAAGCALLGVMGVFAIAGMGFTLLEIMILVVFATYYTVRATRRKCQSGQQRSSGHEGSCRHGWKHRRVLLTSDRSPAELSSDVPASVPCNEPSSSVSEP